MEKGLLEECLAEGMSLEAIGKRVGKHESTVSYWLKKHGLSAAEAEKHAREGGALEGRTRTASTPWNVSARNREGNGSEPGHDSALDEAV